MKYRVGPVESVRLARTLLKSSQKSLISRLRSFFKNLRGGNDLSGVIRFMFGKQERYFGLLINDGKLVKHSLYLLFNNGKVKKIGRVKLKCKNKDRAIKEMYRKLESKGDASKVLSYSPGGEVLFHPN